MLHFEELPLGKSLQRNLKAAGYTEATPIQEKAIPKLLGGRDLVGCAQTGTGKTAAFALPMIHRLLTTPEEQTGAAKRRKRSGRKVIRGLVLVPTRELAVQVSEVVGVFCQATGVRQTVIYGGVRQGKQVQALSDGVDILVATPGRLLDLIGQQHVDLQHVLILVLDEADQMLDMGFIHDLRKIINCVPEDRQTLMFSATMPPEVRELAQDWLRRPQEVKVSPVASTPKLANQSVVFVSRKAKLDILKQILVESLEAKTLVFVKTKRSADIVAGVLGRDGIKAISIHGDKSQARRHAAVRQFESAQPPVLVATDLAARGLDFSNVDQVVNYDMPETAETYVHRIGRTARAGAGGQTFLLCCPDEKPRLRAIEELTGTELVPQQVVPVEVDPSQASRPKGKSKKKSNAQTRRRR